MPANDNATRDAPDARHAAEVKGDDLRDENIPVNEAVGVDPHTDVRDVVGAGSRAGDVAFADDVDGLPPARALAALRDVFGEAIGAEYATGKTAFRDLLVARFGVSELAAEEACDALEAAGDLKFVEENAEWRIHAQPGSLPRSRA